MRVNVGDQVEVTYRGRVTEVGGDFLKLGPGPGVYISTNKYSGISPEVKVIKPTEPPVDSLISVTSIGRGTNAHRKEDDWYRSGLATRMLDCVIGSTVISRLSQALASTKQGR